MNVTDETRTTYGKLRTEIVIPNHATPSLNATLKYHFRDKTNLRKMYERCVWAGTRNQHPGPVRIEIYRHSEGTLDDQNFVGGAKALIDALVNQNVIIDDTDAVLVERHYEQVKIAQNGPKMTVVIIQDL